MTTAIAPNPTPLEHVSSHDRGRVVDTIREHLPNVTEEELAGHISILDAFVEEEQS